MKKIRIGLLGAGGMGQGRIAGFTIIRDASISGADIEALRRAVGWDESERLDEVLSGSYAHFSIAADDRLITFANVISDGVEDAFIVNLLIHPDQQRQGLGQRFVRHIVDALTADGIQSVWVTFDDRLEHLDTFYRKCGFHILKAGVIDNNAPE